MPMFSPIDTARVYGTGVDFSRRAGWRGLRSSTVNRSRAHGATDQHQPDGAPPAGSLTQARPVFTLHQSPTSIRWFLACPAARDIITAAQVCLVHLVSKLSMLIPLCPTIIALCSVRTALAGPD
jgi:hypothetical protein